MSRRATTARPREIIIHALSKCDTLRFIIDVIRKMVEDDGSNRRPPACKAGALPAELILLGQSKFDVLNPFHHKDFK